MVNQVSNYGPTQEAGGEICPYNHYVVFLVLSLAVEAFNHILLPKFHQSHSNFWAELVCLGRRWLAITTLGLFLNCSQTRILTNFSLLLVLEMPAPKTCGLLSEELQILCNSFITSQFCLCWAVLVCSYTWSGCVCRSLLCCPRNLSSGLAWDPKDSIE